MITKIWESSRGLSRTWSKIKLFKWDTECPDLGLVTSGTFSLYQIIFSSLSAPCVPQCKQVAAEKMNKKHPKRAFGMRFVVLGKKTCSRRWRIVPTALGMIPPHITGMWKVELQPIPWNSGLSPAPFQAKTPSVCWGFISDRWRIRTPGRRGRIVGKIGKIQSVFVERIPTSVPWVSCRGNTQFQLLLCCADLDPSLPPPKEWNSANHHSHQLLSFSLTI